MKKSYMKLMVIIVGVLFLTIVFEAKACTTYPNPGGGTVDPIETINCDGTVTIDITGTTDTDYPTDIEIKVDGVQVAVEYNTDGTIEKSLIYDLPGPHTVQIIATRRGDPTKTTTYTDHFSVPATNGSTRGPFIDNNDSPDGSGESGCDDDDDDPVVIDICDVDTTPVYSDCWVLLDQNGDPLPSDTEFSDVSYADLSLKKSISSMSPIEKQSQIYFKDDGGVKAARILSSPDDRDGFGVGPFSKPSWGTASSCGGCGTTAKSQHKTISYGPMNVTIRSREEDTLACRAVYTGDGYTFSADQMEINIGGSWSKVSDRRGWAVGRFPTYIYVRDRVGSLYIYNNSGTIPKDLKLSQIRSAAHSSVLLFINYFYKQNGALDYIEYTENNEDHKITFGYDGNGRLDEVAVLPHGESVAVETVELGHDATTGKLTKTYCAQCQGTVSSEFTYAAAGQEFYHVADGETVPVGYNLTEAKESGVTKFSYKYDEDDRITEHRYDSDIGDLITKWEYDETNDILTEIKRKDYVTHPAVGSPEFRLTVYTFTNGAVTSIKKYHDLLTDDPTGGDDYSETSYSYETSGSDLQYITQLPSGLKHITETDSNGQLKRKFKSYTGETDLVTGQYTYTEHTYDGNSKYLMDAYTNAFSGVTSYTYNDEFDESQRLGVEIVSQNGNGVTDLTAFDERLDSRTEYDLRDRVQYKLHKDSRDKWIGQEYVYDSYGKLDKVKEGVVFTLDNETEANWTVNTATDTDAVITDYTYNLLGELEETAVLEGTTKKNIRRNYYNFGLKVCSALIKDDSETAYAVSASRSTYDTNGRLIIKSVVKEDEPFLESDLEDDLDIGLTVDVATNQVEVSSAPSLTWVHAVYVYDTYGRQIVVVQDANQEGSSARSHLATESDYNHQGEIKEVRTPSGKVVRTTRDGRGLVETEETGYYTGETFTAEITVEYTYDDNGNLKTKTEPHPNVYADSDAIADKVKTVYVYDDFDRLKSSYTEIVYGT